MTNTEYLQLKNHFKKSQDYILTRGKELTAGEALQELGSLFLLVDTLRTEAIKYNIK